MSGFFGKSNITRVRIELGVPAEVYANTEFPLRVRLVNRRRWFPSFLVRVRIGDAESLFPYVRAGGLQEKFVSITAVRRGRHTLPAVSVSSVFPFNFIIRRRRVAADVEYIAFPHPKRCDVRDIAGRERRARGDVSSDRTGYEGDLMSVRDYALGDPLKYIHWKASAKTRELKTKELSAPAQRPVIIDFEKTGIRNLEDRISCVTYILLQLYRRNVPAGLRLPGQVFEPGTTAAHKTAMIRELALYGEPRKAS